MRITQIVETLERGGLERVVVDLCKGLAGEQHDVDVVCLFRRGVLADELESSGIQVSVLHKADGIDLRCAGALRKHLARRRPNVVHSHNAMAGYYSRFTALGALSARWINTRHGMGALSGRSRKERLYRACVRYYDRIAFVCEAARREFMAAGVVGSERSIVLHNGINTSRWGYATAEHRAMCRARLGIAADALVVGSVGRLNWAKNYGSLVRTYQEVFPNPASSDRLVLVGEGEERGTIERAAAEAGIGSKVLLLGDRSDVTELLPGFDIFACSSKTEGYSMALLEAATCGLPVVATAVGGNAEIVRHGESGYIVTYDDSRAFAASLRLLANDPALRRRFGENARSWALRNAGIRQMIERHLDAYRAA
jgi:glycosyltransferase involved in cell wall biosynthesis